MYTIDSTVDEPIMLINTHIGYDAEDGMGIDGASFQRELLELDGMGKKRIQIYINSVGGRVLEGYNICNAILKSKTPVDTYCAGVAASISAVIFLMGRKRVMCDYGYLMVHNPRGGEDKKALDALRDSLTTMLIANSIITAPEMTYLMDRDSWLNSAECFAKGFCTEIEVTSQSNKKRMPAQNATAMWKAGTEILNSILNTNIQTEVMPTTKITMRLKLNDAATEDNIVKAIDDIEDRAYNAETARIAAETKARDIENKLTAATAAHEAKLTELTNKATADAADIARLSALVSAANAEKEAAEKAQKTASITAMVNKYAQAGRIKNEAPVIAKWVAKAEVLGMEEAEELIKDLPLTKAATVIETENKLKEGELGTSAMALAVQNKLRREGKL